MPRSAVGDLEDHTVDRREDPAEDRLLNPANVSKAQFAYDWIRQRVLSQEFTPGYRLVLSSIAGSLGMSVVPVREAIRRLEAEGLVSFQRNVGAQVAMLDSSEYRSTMEVLGLLEGRATAASAPRLTAADLDRARSLNRAMGEVLRHFDPQRFTDLNQQFHRTLTCRCPNQRLNTLVAAEWDRLGQLRASTFSFIPGRAGASVEEHDQIIRMLEDMAPPEEIERVSRAHRLATLHSYLDAQAAG